jgi:hypothetical protein
MMLLLIAALALPNYDIFAECDYGRVLASNACEQREQDARITLEGSFAGYPQAKQAWCIQQVAQRIQINQYLWLKYCLTQNSERPVLPHRVRPFWGLQPSE